MAQLLTTEDAARLLNVAPATLHTWRSRRTVTIPYVKIGSCIRYDVRDLEAWLARQRVTGPEGAR